jgi:orotidine-5'-phosphate decarboxylase
VSLEKLGNLTEVKKSKLILAIDDAQFYDKEFLYKLSPYVVGIKIGLTCLIDSFNKSAKINREVNNDFFIIADLKVADVPHICEKLANLAKNLHFDAIIAHSFIGETSLRAIKNIIPTLAVVTMSVHDSYKYDENVDYFVEISNKLNLSGIIAPATKPEILKKVRKITKLKIFSPGIGAQGMDYGYAIKNGADYEIVGRSILYANNPVLEAKKAIAAYEGRS